MRKAWQIENAQNDYWKLSAKRRKEVNEKTLEHFSSTKIIKQKEVTPEQILISVKSKI